MDTRLLGRTGHKSSLAILGGASLTDVPQADADALLDFAAENGVNHIDVAPGYGKAEVLMAPGIKRHAGHFFIGCKTFKRSAAEAAEELDRSLDRLGVECLDLYQLHAVSNLQDYDKAMGKGGAMEAIVKGKEAGKLKHIGITSHGLKAPEIQLKALADFDFATLMLPLNFQMWANEEFRAKMEELLALAVQKRVGVMVIKAIVKQPWQVAEDKRPYTAWYEPFDDETMIQRCLDFTLARDITCASSVGDIGLARKFIAAAVAFKPLPREEQEKLLATADKYSLLW
jgi:aryl-alcohol dehydrogenase-like predicted oxidoreductase